MGFFEKQCIDDTGRQAVKLERWIIGVLGIYIVHIALAFFLTTYYNTSIIGPIFSIVGLLVGIGLLGSYKRDHTMTCVYIGILAIELVVGIIGTALWVVEGVVIKNTTLQVIGGPKQGQKTAEYLSITLAITIPVVILINLYCLIQAAKLKMALKEGKKQRHALANEERVQLMVEELLMQHMNAYAKPPPQYHSHKSTNKLKQKEVARPQEVVIDVAPVGSGGSAM